MSDPRTLRQIVHAAEVGNASVRFVRSPLGGMDVPWVVACDVVTALGVGQDGLDEVLRSMRHVAPVRMANVDGSLLPIVPPWVLILGAGEALGSRVKVSAIRAMKEAHHRACPSMTAAMRALSLLSSPSAMP